MQTVSRAVKEETHHADLEIDPSISISKYVPEDTTYFYGFPSGEESGFFNAVAPWIEELVSARTLVSAGAAVKVVAFDNASNDDIRALLETYCHSALPPKDHVINLPASLSADIQGKERNEKVKEALLSIIKPGSLMMAQPFLDSETKELFQFDPELSSWFNDKNNLSAYIPELYLPRRYFSFDNGTAFNAMDLETVSLPCVVKLSGSSAGDGVRVCRTPEDLVEAKQAFGLLDSSVFIEECIDATQNYCIQFGIPSDAERAIDIIGYNEQVIMGKGEFVGGIVYPAGFMKDEILHDVFSVMEKVILPEVRRRGWYGVGALDVLVDAGGNFYFIDPNFRQTATFGLVCLSRQGKIRKTAASLIGSFKGPREEFIEILKLCDPDYDDQVMQMVSLSTQENGYRFNAAILYADRSELEQKACLLKERNVESKLIDLILDDEGKELFTK